MLYGTTLANSLCAWLTAVRPPKAWPADTAVQPSVLYCPKFLAGNGEGCEVVTYFASWRHLAYFRKNGVSEQQLLP
jgi:hypothetical protein